MELKAKGLGWAAIGMKMKRVDLTIRYWWRKFKASHKVTKGREERSEERSRLRSQSNRHRNHRKSSERFEKE